MYRKTLIRLVLPTLLLLAAFIIAPTSTSAAPIFAENFNGYNTDADLAGGGWTDTLAGSLEDTSADPMTYCSANEDVYLNGGARAYRITATNNEVLSRDFGSASEGDVYISYLVQVPNAGTDDFAAWFLNDNTGGTHSGDVLLTGLGAFAASPPDNYFLARVDTGHGAFSGTINSFPSPTFFVVAHFSQTGGAGTSYNLAEIWVDPDFGDAATPDASSAAATSGQTTYRYFGIRSNSIAAGEISRFDELRMGTTWADVVPTYSVSVGFVNTSSTGPEGTISAPQVQVTVIGSYTTVQEDIVLTVAATDISTDGSDYTLNTTLTIPAGTADGTLIPLDVTFNDDTDPELDEQVQFDLSGATLPCGASLGTTSHTVTIEDDDNSPPVAVDDAGYTVAEDDSLIGATSVLANDDDVDFDTLTAILDTDVTNGILLLNPDGTFDYTPNADFNGSDSFTYFANDGAANSATAATVTIDVTPVNDAPVAVDDPDYVVNEDEVLNGTSVVANDNDVDGDLLNAVLQNDVSSGVLILNADGTFTYTPNADFNGTDSFTYFANDGTVNSATAATVTITVTPVNDAAPVAVDDPGYVTDEDTPLINATSVLDNDTDVDNDPLTAVLDTDVSNGTLVLDPDGTFDYTPDADFNGTDSFTYFANDGTVNSDTPALVTITVNPVPDAPVAGNDDYIVAEDDQILGATSVLANDADGDNDPLTAVQDSDVSNGTLIFNADGTFDYTPNADFWGTDSFTYHANDGALDSNIATVTITVTPVNDAAPVAVDDPGYVTDEDTPLINATSVLDNDTDVDGDPLTAVLNTTVVSGSLTLNPDGTFDYTPPADFNGIVTFTYHANDGTENSNIATVTITVNSVPDAPIAADDSYTVDEDTILDVPLAVNGVLSNDSDGDGDALTAVLQNDVSNGVLILNADGTFTYTPNADFWGTDSFIYFANDGTVNSDNPATVTITVTPVNDAAPVAVDDPGYVVNEDEVLNGTSVLINDTDFDNDPLTAVLQNDVSNGVLNLNADGTFTYTPNADFNGTDSFTYFAHDGTVPSDLPATVTITVNPVNDPPVAVDDTGYTTDEDTPLVAVASVLDNDSDLDGDALDALLAVDAANGTVALNPDGTFTYTPNADFNGSDSFTYFANDGTDNSDTAATVTIMVTAVNDAPVAADDIGYTVAEDGSLTGAASVLANDTDVDGDALDAVLDTPTTNGTVNLFADGTFDYTPNADFNGSDSFTYHANDGLLDSNIATVTITVTPVNDAPVAVDDPGYSTAEDTPLIGAASVLTNDSDVDGDLLDAVLISNAANGTVILNPDGTFNYTPDADFNGTDSFTYVADDSTAVSNTATVTITVTAVNDAPVITTNNGLVIDEDTVGIIGTAELETTDVDGDLLTYTLSSTPPSGTLANDGVTLGVTDTFTQADIDANLITFTPIANANGLFGFTFSVTDGEFVLNDTFFIMLTPVNDAPVAVDDPSYTVAEDGSLTGATSVLTNDIDVDGDALDAVLDTPTTNGTVNLFADGTFDYTPNADFNGSDSFTYHANDGLLDSNIATVTITVTPVNDAPVAVDDPGYTVAEDGNLTGAASVLVNDIDVDGDLLEAVLDTPAANGTVTLFADGTFDYTPNADFNGSDSFTYVANDGTDDSNVATVTITVTPVNDAPVAVDDTGYTVAEDGNLTGAASVLVNDTDVDGDLLEAVLDSPATNGTVTLFADGTFDYTPDADFNGSDSFTYHANDGLLDSNIATVTITVTPVNDAPVAVDDPGYTVAEDGSLIGAASVLVNDIDVDLDTLNAVLITNVSDGSLLFFANGTFNYTPNADFNGTDSFTYRAFDGSTLSATAATVTITVTAVNDAPVATDDTGYTVAEDGSLTGAASVLTNDNDVDGDLLEAVLDSPATNGTVTLFADGTFDYTPDADFNGSDSFTYVANDGTVDSNVATVTITVTAVNDAPVAVNDSYNVESDAVLNVAAIDGVLANDTDVDGQPLSAVLVDGPANASGFTLNADGSFSYTPAAGFVGADSFTYQADDSVALSNVATVTISVSNTAPVAVNDSYSTPFNTPLNVLAVDGVLVNDTDVDGQPLSAVLVDGPAHASSFTLNADGSFSYTPAVSYFGPDSFTYQADDGIDLSNVATVNINVTVPNTLTLLSPTGTVTDSLGNVTYQWTDQLGATSYNLYVHLTSNVNNAVVNIQNISDVTYCNGSVCTLDIVSAFGNAYWLLNNNYTVWIRANPGGVWTNTGTFTLQTPHADPVTIQPPTDTHTLRPTLHWTLENEAVWASWFRLYVAPSNSLGSPLLDQWVMRGNVCGSLAGTTCNFTLPLDLAPNGTYQFWALGWGPGGPTSWIGSGNFQIGPAIPTGLTVNSVTAGVPALSWTAANGVTWYQVWIGTFGPTVQELSQWYTASALGCAGGGTCTLPPNAVTLTSGTYLWYVRGWGPAGYTLGGVSGWAQGPDIIVP